MQTRPKLKEFEAEMAALEDAISDHRLVVGGLGNRARELGAPASHEIAERLQRTRSDLEAVNAITSGPATARWSLERWAGWDPLLPVDTSAVRVGEYREQRTGQLLGVPAMVPLLGSGRALCVTSTTSENVTTAVGLMHSLVVRAAALLGGRSRITLLDPAGVGAFPFSSSLADLTTSTGDLRRDLDVVLALIERRQSAYLDSRHPTFEDVPLDVRLNEPYHLVAAAGFPLGYDHRTADALERIAEIGPRCGVYLIVHEHNDQRDTSFDRYRFSSANRVNLDELNSSIGGIPVSVVLDGAPPSVVQDVILDRIQSSAVDTRILSWDDVAGLPSDSWWEHSADEQIAAPIGRHGSGHPLRMWFGADQMTSRQCSHGALAAMRGAGRSTLLDNFICGLSVRYNPEELHLYLIDGPHGSDFQVYRDLPHAALVSVRTAAPVALDILATLVTELDQRQSTFTEAGAHDFSDYRQRGQALGSMARLLVVIDDWTDIFSGDPTDGAAEYLNRLVKDGRRTGIHLLLCASRLDATDLGNHADLFGSLHLRAVMQLSQADVSSLSEFSLRGRRLVAEQCTSVGRIVVNDRGGDDEANLAGLASRLSPGRRNSLVREVAARARLRGNLTIPDCVFLQGDAVPGVLGNPLVQRLATGSWLDPATLADLARRTTADGGLGIDTWVADQLPLLGWVGQSLGLDGHVSIMLDRTPTSHLAVVGGDPSERHAMLATFVATCALSASPFGLRVWVGDAGPTGIPTSRLLADVAGGLSAAGYVTSVSRSADAIAVLVRDTIDELDRRISRAADDEPTSASLIVVLNDLDRVGSLQRLADEYGFVDSPLALGLRRVLMQGPAFGVHVILGAGSVGLLELVLAARHLDSLVRHRVALAMSEEQSYTIIGSRQAARLARAAGRPAGAVVHDHQSGFSAQFKPYSTRGSVSLDDELSALLGTLRAWGDDRRFDKP